MTAKGTEQKTAPAAKRERSDLRTESAVTRSSVTKIAIANLPKNNVALDTERTIRNLIGSLDLGRPNKERLERLIDELSLNMLDSEKDQAVAVLEQVLRKAYLDDIDILVVSGESFDRTAVELVSRFTARFTVALTVDHDPTMILPRATDRRSVKDAGRSFVVMSPFEDCILDATSHFRANSFLPTLPRHSSPEEAGRHVDISPISIKLQNENNALECAVEEEELAYYAEYTSDPDHASTKRVLLYPQVDTHALEIESALENLCRSPNWETYARDMVEEFERYELTPREKLVLQNSKEALSGVDGCRHLWRVFSLPESIATSETIQYQILESVLPKIQRLILGVQQNESTDTKALDALEEVWTRVSALMHAMSNVSSRLLRLQDRKRSDAEAEAKVAPIFLGTLTSTTTGNEALEVALVRQARLLSVINRMRATSIRLQYLIRTEPTRNESLAPRVDILCLVEKCTQLEAVNLQQSLGQLVHATFVGLYGLSFQIEGISQGDAGSLRQSYRYRAKIRPDLDSSGIAIVNTFPDWAHVLDYMTSLPKPCALRLSVAAGPETANRPDAEQDSFNRNETGQRHSHQPQNIIDNVMRRANVESEIVTLDVELCSDDPIQQPLVEMICAEISGGTKGAWTRNEEEGWSFDIGIADALRIFHPPFGEWYGISLAPRPLKLNARLPSFPVVGIPLGDGRVSHPRGDMSVTVRLPENDRVRHVYVVGKTGTGKTNLLRHMISSELSNPSVGLAVIDPHGDLAGHFMNLLPRSRFSDVQIIDLSDEDLTPVMNPLLYVEGDELRKARLTQDILEVLKLRVFHEFAGPRFDELVRLVLDTLLDDGYPDVPSLVDASPLLTDAGLQKKVRSSLRDKDLLRRWEFHDKLKKGNEYYDLVDWVVSKFDDFRTDSTLRAILGGESNTVDIDATVRANGLLIVSLPESVVGRSTAEFVGSLVMLQMKNALLRRVPGRCDPFFVYLDEFQKFAGVGFEDLLAEARKFGVGLIMAHQNIEQIHSFSARTGTRSKALINSILGNVGTIVSFPVGVHDAEILAPQMGMKTVDFAKIGRHQAVARMTIDGVQTPAFTLQTRYAEQYMDPRKLDDMREWLTQAERMADRVEVLASVDGRAVRLASLTGHASSSLERAGSGRPGSSFLDEWLEKRKHVSGPQVDAVPLDAKLPSGTDSSESSGLDRSGPTVLQGSSSRLSSWHDIIGPMLRVSTAAARLGISSDAVLGRASENEILLLTTSRGTRLVPESHIREGSMVPGLSNLLVRLSRAPFSPWTKAAWLATPLVSLGMKSPLDFLQSEKDYQLLWDVAAMYSEEV